MFIVRQIYLLSIMQLGKKLNSALGAFGVTAVGGFSVELRIVQNGGTALRRSLVVGGHIVVGRGAPSQFENIRRHSGG